MSRTIVVSGASSGIGRSISERLLSEGHRVIGLARDHSKFDPKSDAYLTRVVDLADPAQVHNTFEGILAEFPQLCTVISNAGVGTVGCLEEFSMQQIENSIQINLISHLYVARAVLPHFKKQGKGDLIFTGSESSLRGAAKGTLYCAAKFGMRGMTQSLRQECSRNGVRVMGIYPGMVRTPFFDELSFEPGADVDNAIAPEDVAKVVSTMLSLPRNTVIDEVELTPLKKVVSRK